MRRPNETLTVVDDSTRASGQLAAFNTLLCASDAVYEIEFFSIWDGNSNVENRMLWPVDMGATTR